MNFKIKPISVIFGITLMSTSINIHAEYNAQTSNTESQIAQAADQSAEVMPVAALGEDEGTQQPPGSKSQNAQTDVQAQQAKDDQVDAGPEQQATEIKTSVETTPDPSAPEQSTQKESPSAQSARDQTVQEPVGPETSAGTDAVTTLYELEGTLNSVLDTLVEQKLLTREQADAIVQSAQQQAKEKVEEAGKPEQTIVEEKPPQAAEKIIRVPYVPEHVKQQLRDEISNGLREDTVDAVLAQAKQERWGMPGVTPEWVDRIKWKGDIRLRAQFDRFDEDNALYLDFQSINDAGGFNEAGTDAFLNTTENRERLRLRARLGMDAKVTAGLKAKFRITTGNIKDPVSTNQTLGNYGNKFSLVLDRAYLQYDGVNADGYPYLTLYGGRMKNPFFSTDVVWDKDLAFDGIAFTYRANMRGSEDLLEMTENDRTFLFTLGAFPLQEVESSSKDKWLYGTQVRTEFIFENQSVLNFAVAYYVYDNITGQINSTDSDLLDYTAPEFMQKGNTLFNIHTSTSGGQELFALASDYEILDVNLLYDLADFSPYHVIMGLNYVKNFGYDKEEIQNRVQGRVTTNPLDEKTEAYKIEVQFGWPRVTYPGNWRVSLAYKYVEQDAVLDSFTDSDFHLGGTDAKGYIIGFEYGMLDNTWLNFRFLSADAIDQPPLAIDVLQLDVNAKF